MKAGCFITGTDTGVGKTLFSTALVHALVKRGYRVAGMKPVASGCEESAVGLRNDDAMQLMQAANVPLDYEQVNPYAFAPAIAPHLAAAQAHATIDTKGILDIAGQVQQQAEYLVVEGVGGWQVPLNETHNVSHLAVMLGFPVVLVVGLRLGCINHALLTADAIRQAGLPLAGWVANEIGPAMFALEENIETLHDRLSAPMLVRIPFREQQDPRMLAETLDCDNIIQQLSCL